MGFNIEEIVESKGYKKFMTKLYGIGAAVVIIGALFKIQHWPGSAIMLIAGLGTEAVIFFLSAFEPLHEELDWTLAYPELAGIETEDEEKEKRKTNNPMAELQDMIEKANLNSDTFDKLGQGLSNLNQTTAKLADISDASLATNEYVQNVKSAAQSMGNLSNSYTQSIESLNQTAQSVGISYQNTAETISRSASEFANKMTKSADEIHDIMTESGKKVVVSYQELAEAMTKEVKNAAENNKTYNEQLISMTKNLGALNSVYELQLQGSNEHLKASEELYSGIDGMMKSLKDSAEEAKRYQVEVSKLGNNLAALNTVYGNMLAAMNVFPTQK